MATRTVEPIPDDSPLRNPKWTTPHSRHAEMIAEALINDGVSHDCATDPAWAGESILAAVRGMWEAKAENEQLKEAIRRLAEQDATLSVVGGNVIVQMDATLTEDGNSQFANLENGISRR